MTSSTTKIQAVNDGTTTKKADSAEESIGKLRQREAVVLISLICDAISSTSKLTYSMHVSIYDDLDTVPVDQLRERLYAALTCMGTADHYLRMLDEALADIPAPQPDEPPF